MGMTSIEWTDETWNPITGCTKVSAGCKNCYAEKVADRFWGDRKFTDVQTHADRLDQPLRWRRPRRVFVNSMSELFHDAVPDAFIDRVFAVMALAPQHTFQVLTKRPGRMLKWFTGGSRPNIDVYNAAADLLTHDGGTIDFSRMPLDMAHTRSSGGTWWPLPNVWLGVSVEDQRAADERIPLLLQTPAVVRFLSCEPLLGPVDLHQIANHDGLHASALQQQHDDCFYQFDSRVDWVIVGGESGPGARPCDVAWIRSLVQQCKGAGTACFVKQMGTRAGLAWTSKAGGREFRDIYTRDCGFWPPEAGDEHAWILRMKDRKGGDPAEWPEDLRVREFPAVEARA